MITPCPWHGTCCRTFWDRLGTLDALRAIGPSRPLLLLPHSTRRAALRADGVSGHECVPSGVVGGWPLPPGSSSSGYWGFLGSVSSIPREGTDGSWSANRRSRFIGQPIYRPAYISSSPTLFPGSRVIFLFYPRDPLTPFAAITGVSQGGTAGGDIPPRIQLRPTTTTREQKRCRRDEACL